MDRTRVLVVDDHADLRSSLKELLELLGYEVETARDGAAALALQDAKAVAIVITDIFMPGTEGMETIAKFKDRWPKVRVIAMSGGGEVAKKSYLQDALHIGADAILTKPFTLQTLRNALSPGEMID
ncbi:MAG: response regulator [Betaproteobacteria bacterium]|nr:response regulator [Betaproteobacteria bacterium]MBV9361550.1 response regulator [Betaproteobacteria bacterium]